MEQVWVFDMDDITEGCVSEAWLHNFNDVVHMDFFDWIEENGFEDMSWESDGRIIETMVDEDNGLLQVVANFDMECALYEDDVDDYDDEDDDDSDDDYDEEDDED